MKKTAIIFIAIATLIFTGLSFGQYTGPAENYTRKTGPKYYFNLFVNKVSDSPMATGYLANKQGTQRQILPVINIDFDSDETLDVSIIEKIEIIPGISREAGSHIKNDYNNYRIHLKSGDVITARTTLSLSIVINSGRIMNLSSRNPVPMFLLSVE